MQTLWENRMITIPMPIFLVIEDVGWWQGEDGSAINQPYRNSFSRRHCLDDYRALFRLAKKLNMRIALAMVMGEWDRTNLLKNITGATWLGFSWDNHINQGKWLDETAQYLFDHKDSLEIAMHGLCHEFWRNGLMERSEFHDSNGVMRQEKIIRSHIEAFGALLEQNNLPVVPRLFIPPALKHSFGNGRQSIQALLYEYGIRYVVTDFARARQYSPPFHDKISWESGVGLMERGKAPVSWNQPAALPAWDLAGPILPLHWGNLLHPDPAENDLVVDRWAEFLLAAATRADRIMAENIDNCWQQAAVSLLADLRADDHGLSIDLSRLPDEISRSSNAFSLKIQARLPYSLKCRGARIVFCKQELPGVRTLSVLPDKGQKKIFLSLQ